MGYGGDGNFFLQARDLGFKLYREKILGYHDDDLREPINEIICVEEDFQNYATLENFALLLLKTTFSLCGQHIFIGPPQEHTLG